MNIINFLMSFLGGSIVTTLIFVFLLRSDSFVTWLVETINQILIKRMSTQKQNDFTNYLGVFFVNMGVKFIESIQDVELQEDLENVKLQYNNLKHKLLQKNIVSPEDIQYIDSLHVNNKQNNEQEQQ